MNFLLGTKTLEEVESPINGKISVIKSLAFGTYIQVEGLTQSGGVVYNVWKTTLKKVKKQKLDVQSCLILGLGGGSAARIVKKFWPDAKITGVDKDPIIVELGKKYLSLDEENVKVVINDVEELLSSHKSLVTSHKYELVLVDMYVGTEVPKQFESGNFVRSVKKLLKKDGVAVFNRLYYGEKRTIARKFLDILSKHFSSVTPIYPEANVMFVSRI